MRGWEQNVSDRIMVKQRPSRRPELVDDVGASHAAWNGGEEVEATDFAGFGCESDPDQHAMAEVWTPVYGA